MNFIKSERFAKIFLTVLVASFVAIVAVRASTITTINGTDTISSSRAVINTNFSNLNTDKLEKSGGTMTGTLIGTGATFSFGEFATHASASAFKGSAFNGVGDCNDTTEALGWDLGTFSCVTVGTGSGGSFSGLDVDAGGTAVKVSSLTFDPNHFNFSNTASSGYVRLDWTNGPASRSASQTVTGAWNFSTRASVSQLDVGPTEFAPITGGVLTSVMRIGDTLDGASGVEMTNTSAGTNADFRFIISDSTDHYLAFAQPGTGNTGALFGKTRSNTDLIFSNGGTARTLMIGNVQNAPVSIGTNNLERFTVFGGGGASLSGAFEVEGAASVSGQFTLNNNASISANFEVGTNLYRFTSTGASISQPFEIVNLASVSSLRVGTLAGALYGTAGAVGTNTFLTNLAALSGPGTGLIIHSGTDSFVERSIESGGNGISVSNGSGVSGNPSIALNTAGTVQLATLTLTGALAGTTASFSSNTEAAGYASASKYFGGGLNLMGGTDGCSAAGDTLNYTLSTGVFSCGTDATGAGGVSSNSLDFDEFVNSMTVDANTTITAGANALIFTRASVSGNLEIGGTASISTRLNIGNSLNAARLATGSGPRAFNMIDTAGVLRVWRYAAFGSDPSVEWVGGTNDDVANVANSWWDAFTTTAPPNDTFTIRRRTGGVSTNELTIGATGAVFADNASVSGNFEVTGSLQAGATILSSTLNVTGLATFGAITATGIIDFGGATSFEIPNSAGGTTVDTTGEVTMDTTSDSFNYFNGTIERVISPKRCYAFNEPAPTNKKQWTIGFADQPLTVSEVYVTASGSNAVGYQIKHGTTTAGLVNLFSADRSASSSDGSLKKITSFNDATLTDGSKIDVVITSTSGVLSSFYARICGHIDAP